MKEGIVALAVTFAAAGLPCVAQDKPPEPKLGWSTSAELAMVVTSGNAETTTLGFTDKTVRTWARSSFEIDAAAVRAESTISSPVAIDADGDGVVDFVDEQKDTQTTAERYIVLGRYDKKITDRFFWFAGASWDRNQPSGIDDRYIGFGGVGNIWRDDDRTKFRTDYSLTYTDEQDVVEPPDFDGTFIGLRLSSVYIQKIGKSTTFEDDLILDDNADETSDFRVDFYNSLTVAMTDRLALKVGYRMLYDNEPAIGLIPVTSTNPGAPLTFPLEKDDLDTIFTTSLVVKF